MPRNNRTPRVKRTLLIRRALLLVTVFALFAAPVLGAGSISITSVDLPTSVTKGDGFTLSASVSGSEASDVSGTVTTPDGISCSPTGSQDISLDGNGQGSASWSCTGDVAGDYTNEVTVSVSATDSGTGGSLSDSTQDGLSVLAPASLTVSSSLSDASIDTDGSTTFTVSVHNTGGASTSYSISTSPGGVSFSVSSGSASGNVGGDGVKTVGYTVSSSSADTYDLTATVSGGNGQTLTTTETLTVSEASSTSTDDTSSGGGGGYTSTTTDENETTADNETDTDNETVTDGASVTVRPGLSRAKGLTNNTKLQDALAKVLAKGKLSDQARDNLLDISEAITAKTEVVREAKRANDETAVTTTVQYNGGKALETFVFYDQVPKTFANHTDHITVNAPNAAVDIIESDPEYMFTYSDVSQGDSVEITYAASSSGTQDGSALESLANTFGAEVYGAYSATTTDEPTSGDSQDQPTEPQSTDGSGFPLLPVAAVIIIAGLVGAGYYYRDQVQEQVEQLK